MYTLSLYFMFDRIISCLLHTLNIRLQLIVGPTAKKVDILSHIHKLVSTLL